MLKDWKESNEGRTFLEDVSLQASKIGQTEALRKVRLVLERLTPGLNWAEVEEGVKGLFQEEGAAEVGQAEDQVPPPANLEGSLVEKGRFASHDLRRTDTETTHN